MNFEDHTIQPITNFSVIKFFLLYQMICARGEKELKICITLVVYLWVET